MGCDPKVHLPAFSKRQGSFIPYPSVVPRFVPVWARSWMLDDDDDDDDDGDEADFLHMDESVFFRAYAQMGFQWYIVGPSPTGALNWMCIVCCTHLRTKK